MAIYGPVWPYGNISIYTYKYIYIYTYIYIYKYRHSQRVRAQPTGASACLGDGRMSGRWPKVILLIAFTYSFTHSLTTQPLALPEVTSDLEPGSWGAKTLSHGLPKHSPLCCKGDYPAP